VRVFRGDHINPGMMRIFDRLEDTPRPGDEPPRGNAQADPAGHGADG
jgi:hypothetical protein